MKEVDSNDNFQEPEGAENRLPWTRKDNLKLIEAYKKKLHLFKSSKIRKENIWKLIAEDIKPHSAEQCQNKFKYLKAKYIKKKENMSYKKQERNLSILSILKNSNHYLEKIQT